MERDLISIGKMARMSGLSVPTLRLYDEMGLLKPARVDKKTGYRYYSLSQNARLDMIAYMKELGMSLSEISDVLKKEDLALIEQILARKNEQLHEQMRELKSRHEAVERAIASIERYRKSPATGTVSLEYIDRRVVVSMPCREDFYRLGLQSYENSLAGFRRALAEKGLPQVHSYNVATTITSADFAEEKYVPDRFYAFLGPQDINRPDAEVLDSGMYACIYLDSFDREIESAGRLRDICRENGYRICGDYICEVLTEFNVFDSRTRAMFLRLQVPVRF